MRHEGGRHPRSRSSGRPQTPGVVALRMLILNRVLIVCSFESFIELFNT
jgi:hypothetical protein